MTVYISGPITNQPNGNKQAFYQAAKDIRQYGHEPVNPHEVCRDLPEGSPWEFYMELCIKAVFGCQAMVMLPGWTGSKGARVEHAIALNTGMPIEYL